MTLNEIEQRPDALQEEKDKLTAELERLKAEEEHKEVKPWRALSLRIYRLHTQRTPFIQLAFKKVKDNGCKWRGRAEKIFDGRFSAESLGKIDWDNAEVNSDEM